MQNNKNLKPDKQALDKSEKLSNDNKDELNLDDLKKEQQRSIFQVDEHRFFVPGYN